MSFKQPALRSEFPPDVLERIRADTGKEPVFAIAVAEDGTEFLFHVDKLVDSDLTPYTTPGDGEFLRITYPDADQQVCWPCGPGRLCWWP